LAQASVNAVEKYLTDDRNVEPFVMAHAMAQPQLAARAWRGTTSQLQIAGAPQLDWSEWEKYYNMVAPAYRPELDRMRATLPITSQGGVHNLQRIAERVAREHPMRK